MSKPNESKDGRKFLRSQPEELKETYVELFEDLTGEEKEEAIKFEMPIKIVKVEKEAAVTMPKVASEKGKRSKNMTGEKKRKQEEMDARDSSTDEYESEASASSYSYNLASKLQFFEKKDDGSGPSTLYPEEEQTAFKSGLVKGGKPAPAKASPAKGESDGNVQKESDENENDEDGDE